MSGFGGDDWDDIEAEGIAARAAMAPGAPSKAAAPAPPALAASNAPSSAYVGGGMSMDDDPFADDLPGGALELDLPSHHQAQAPRSVPSSKPPQQHPHSAPPPHHAPPSIRSAPPAQPSHPPQPQSMQPGSSPSFRPREASLAPPGGQGGPQSIQPRYPSTSADPASLIARYPAPPTKIHETPLYAFRVLVRQYELREDLASLRKRRSPDVPLYERAIHTHDARTFRLGLLLSGAVFTVGTFVFFLPVILRFMRD